jgi:hypothetical protein
MSAKPDKTDTSSKKRFTVHWVAQRQERHSAPMTEVEAQRFLDKLRSENAESPSIREAIEGLRYQRSA